MLEFFAMLKSRVVAQLKWIITSDDKYLESVQKVNEYFVNLDKPKNLDADSVDNYIVKTRKQFQQLCVTLMISGVDKPDEMSVFAFMETIHHYESKRNTPNGPNRQPTTSRRAIHPRKNR